MAISSGTWVPFSEVGLNQAISTTSTTQYHQVGHRVRCRDVGSTAYGEGEFIYLIGVASTAVGDAVVYDLSTGLTTRTVLASAGPMAIAMSANSSTSNYGWYQIQGVGVATVGTVLDNGAVYTTATDGTLDDAQVDSSQVIGATFRSATDTGKATIQLSFPIAGADDQVT